MCVELDCDGGASQGAGDGATVVTVTGATAATGATVALGGGAVIDHNPIPAAPHFKCCECDCDRYPGC